MVNSNMIDIINNDSQCEIQDAPDVQTLSYKLHPDYSNIYNNKLDYTRFGLPKTYLNIDELNNIITNKKDEHIIDRIRNENFKFYHDIDFGEEQGAIEFMQNNTKDDYIDHVLTCIQNVFYNNKLDNYSHYFIVQLKSDHNYNKTELKIHLIYYNLIVNKHYYILLNNLIIDELKNNNKFNLDNNIIDKIHDKSLSGLRFPYQTKPKDINKIYYYNTKLNDMLDYQECDNYKLTLLNSDKEISKELININDTMILKKHKHINININQNNKCDNNINIIDDNIKPCHEDVELCKKYLELIKLNDEDSYNKWLNFIFFCKTNKYYNLGYELSDKDNKTINIITATYKVKNINNNVIDKGTLLQYIKKYDKNFKYGNNMQHINIQDFLIKYSTPQFNHNDIIIEESSKYITYDKIKDHMFKNDLRKILTLQSPTGTGKTTIVNNIFNDLINNNDEIRILSIVSLITLAETQKHCFNDKFISYLNLKHKTNYIHEQFFISSIEQLQYLNSDYNVVYIDEFSNFIQRLFSNTVKNLRSTIINLYNILLNAKIIIVSDATIHNYMLKFLRKFNENSTFIYYKNSIKNKIGYNANIYNTKDEEEFLTESGFFSDTNPKFIFTDTLTIINKLKTILDNNNIEYIEISQKNYSRNLIFDNLKNNKKVFISTPKLLYGYDINKDNNGEQYKLSVYAIYKGKVLDCFQYYQQLNRIRYNNNLNINFKTNNTINTFYYKDFKHFHKKYYNNYVLIKHYLKEYFDINIKVNKDDRIFYTEFIQSSFFNENLKCSCDNFNLGYLLMNQGYKVNYYNLDNKPNKIKNNTVLDDKLFDQLLNNTYPNIENYFYMRTLLKRLEIIGLTIEDIKNGVVFDIDTYKKILLKGNEFKKFIIALGIFKKVNVEQMSSKIEDSHLINIIKNKNYYISKGLTELINNILLAYDNNKDIKKDTNEDTNKDINKIDISLILNNFINDHKNTSLIKMINEDRVSRNLKKCNNLELNDNEILKTNLESCINYYFKNTFTSKRQKTILINKPKKFIYETGKAKVKNLKYDEEMEAYNKVDKKINTSYIKLFDITTIIKMKEYYNNVYTINYMSNQVYKGVHLENIKNMNNQEQDQEQIQEQQLYIDQERKEERDQKQIAKASLLYYFKY